MTSASDSGPASQPPASRISIWARLFCVCVTVAGLYYVWAKLDLRSLSQTLGRARPMWLVPGVLLFGSACLVAVWRLHLMFRLTRTVVHLGATSRLVFIGHFFYTIFLGAAGGDLVKTGLYARWYGRPVPDVLAAISLDRVLGLSGLIIFSIGAFILALLSDAFARLGEVRLPWVAIAGLGAAGIAALVILRVWRPKGESLPARVGRALIESAHRLLVSPRTAAGGLICGVTVQSALSCVLALNLAAVASGPLPWGKFFWAFPVMFALSGLPISVGGLGVRESAAVTLLGWYGVPAETAVAASLLTFFAGVIWMLVGGFIYAREESRRIEARLDPKTISVVIPTLNEAPALEETVRRIRAVPEISEIIVVDGQSGDQTAQLAARLGCRVLAASSSRGGQLRAGAMAATGDVVLLLHADTWIPAGAGRAALDTLRDRTVVAGGFWKVFRESHWLLRGSRFKCALRLFLGRRIAGDQGIFVRRQVLEAIGGVPELPLMEEFELCRRLRKAGRLALADATVATSARRFESRGILRTYFRMWRVMIRYYLGASPQELLETYERP